MGTAVEGAVGSDESASTDGYETGIQESGIEVDVDTFANPRRMRMGIVERWGWRYGYLRLVP